jgi:hypothetical protein
MPNTATRIGGQRGVGGSGWKRATPSYGEWLDGGWGWERVWESRVWGRARAQPGWLVDQIDMSRGLARGFRRRMQAEVEGGGRRVRVRQRRSSPARLQQSSAFHGSPREPEDRKSTGAYAVAGERRCPKPRCVGNGRRFAGRWNRTAREKGSVHRYLPYLLPTTRPGSLAWSAIRTARLLLHM